MQSTNGADWREEGTFFCEALLHIFAVVMWIKIIWHGYFIYNFFFMSKLNNLLGKWHSFLIKRRVVRSNTQMFCRAWFGPVTGRLWELLSLTLRLFSPKSSLTFSFFWKCNRSCAVQLMDFIKQTQSSFISHRLLLHWLPIGMFSPLYRRLQETVTLSDFADEAMTASPLQQQDSIMDPYWSPYSNVLQTC